MKVVKITEDNTTTKPLNQNRMILQTRMTYDFIEIKVDEIKTTIFKSDIKEIDDTIQNLLQVVDELKTLKERYKIEI